MRQSGILMHITSLPGPYGIGTMGKEAFAFVDFLKEAGQRCWQILPLTPTGYGDSPYQSCSAFAGNHYLIDLDLLVKAGLLTKEELAQRSWGDAEDRVDFGLQYKNRLAVLRTAFSRFDQSKRNESFIRFKAANDSWLPDFAMFMALKEKFAGQPWYTWEEGLRLREKKAMAEAWTELEDEIQFFCFVQYLFFKQWDALHSYAGKNGVQIIGDVPIYVPYDSVEVWANPELFQLDQDGTPTAVAGCPPDAFTEDGQLWGNPLYRWDVMAKDGYSWWIRRLQAAGKLYDVIRLDHFRGFESYWAVPYGDKTARGGKWVKGPDMAFVEAVKKALPDVSLIAEDLGFLTQEVLDLRDASGFPGMKVLEFAFDSREPSDYLPHNYSANSVCYVGTHDNMTCRQWFDTASKEAVAYATEYMTLTKAEGLVWGTVRTAMASVSKTCIVQMQDYLNLGAAARMNFPGTCDGTNWTWRAKKGFAPKRLAKKIRAMTKLYGRI